MKSIIVDSLAQLPFQNENQKHLLLTLAKNAWSKNHMEDRVLNGIKLIKAKIKLNTQQIIALEKWKENFIRDYAENQEFTENPKVINLKNTLGFDEHIIQAILNEGREYLKKMDFLSAASLFSFLAMLNPLSSESWVSLGTAEHHLGYDNRAEIDFSLALGIAPQDLDVLYHIGRFYQDQGNKKVACEFFQLVVDSDKENDEIKNYCRRLLA